MVEDKRRLIDIADYYSRKLFEHGETARGVDWKDSDGQVLRFEQLFKVIGSKGVCSINEIGCGYGAFVDFLIERHPAFTYDGLDIAGEMISAARQRHRQRANVSFDIGTTPRTTADYTFASGVYNVKLDWAPNDWKRHIEFTLDIMNVASRKGFAFNCLTSYSDPEKMKDHLYYGDPCMMFDLCKRRYSKDVALLHDYGLYEFTIIVRKLA